MQRLRRAARLQKLDKQTTVICKSVPGVGSMMLAFLTGAGVATGAILLAKSIEQQLPSVDRLLGKCDRAAERLERQAAEVAGIATA